MDDLRLEQTLRTIDRPSAPDPRFLDGLYEDLATELGFRDRQMAVQPARRQVTMTAAAGAAPIKVAAGTSAKVAAGVLAKLPLAAALGAAAIAGAAIAAVVLQAQPPTPPPPPVRPSLLEIVKREKILTVVVSSGRPQARSTQGAIGGFDLDVTTELAHRLGVAPGPRAVADPLGDTGADWQVALPATGVDDALRARYAVSTPITWWPAYLVVPTGSPVVTVADLTGDTICVVAGSTGEDWLRQAPVRSATPTVPAPAATAMAFPDDDACLDALAAGDVQAAVTASIDPAGLTTRGDVRAVGGPVLTEERGAVIDPTTGDPAELLAAIDTAIEAARADGTLADLARSRFGGFDLSAPPVEPTEEP